MVLNPNITIVKTSLIGSTRGLSFAPLKISLRSIPPSKLGGRQPNAQDNIQLQLFLYSRAPWYNNSMRLIVGQLYLPGSNVFGLLRLNDLISRPFF